MDSGILMDYDFLFGKTFAVKDQLFEVREVTQLDTHQVVRATSKSEGGLIRRLFPADAVVKALVVEEEIELFQPTFYGVAAGTC